MLVEMHLPPLGPLYAETVTFRIGYKSDLAHLKSNACK